MVVGERLYPLATGGVPLIPYHGFGEMVNAGHCRLRSWRKLRSGLAACGPSPSHGWLSGISFFTAGVASEGEPCWYGAFETRLNQGIAQVRS
jgi:hypothetical protein